MNFIYKIIILLIILFIINNLTENKILNIMKSYISKIINNKSCNHDIHLLSDIEIPIINTHLNKILNNNIIIMNKLYYINIHNNKYFYNIVINNNNELYNIDFSLINNNIKILNINKLELNNNNLFINNNENNESYSDNIPSIISITET